MFTGKMNKPTIPVVQEKTASVMTKRSPRSGTSHTGSGSGRGANLLRLRARAKLRLEGVLELRGVVDVDLRTSLKSFDASDINKSICSPGPPWAR